MEAANTDRPATVSSWTTTPRIARSPRRSSWRRAMKSCSRRRRGRRAAVRPRAARLRAARRAHARRRRVRRPASACASSRAAPRSRSYFSPRSGTSIPSTPPSAPVRDDFLTKPVRPTELALRVQAAVKLRRLGSELREHWALIRRQRDDLLRMQLQKEQLTAFVVHDLKNPVNSDRPPGAAARADPRSARACTRTDRAHPRRGPRTAAVDPQPARHQQERGGTAGRGASAASTSTRSPPTRSPRSSCARAMPG